ncbi:hypothetical protein [Stenotrophomonas sp. SG1]|uniref:hypothetical protein n=1 Tax=Stenotrophomonas sp. SG1 TaxID=2944932 RepID=UPI00224416BA|nr:hypothetical protein [Stenotrophomonas sp. SG1]MCW8340609.1 hypothetical protein [Stenotrophomonas sp. SG1]
MEIFTIEEEKRLIDAVKGSARLYVQTQAEGDLKTMVDDVCALIGLQFAKRISNQQPSRSLDLVRARCGTMSHLEIGSDIISCSGLGSDAFRHEVAPNFGDMMDLSIPTMMPMLCDIFMRRLSRRFNMGEDMAAFVAHAKNDRQQIAITRIDADRVEFNVLGDEDNTWYANTNEVLLQGSGRSLTLASALSQMSHNYKTRHAIQQQMLI